MKQVQQLIHLQPSGFVLASGRWDYEFQEPVGAESPGETMTILHFERLEAKTVQRAILLVVIAGFYDQTHAESLMPEVRKRGFPCPAITSFRQGLAPELVMCGEHLAEPRQVVPAVVILHVQAIQSHPAVEGSSGELPDNREGSVGQKIREGRP